MALQAGIGLSQNKDSKVAAEEALAVALNQIEGKSPNLVYILSSFSAYDHGILLKTIKTKLGNVPLAGGTTAGEIFNDQSLDGSLVVLALKSEEVSFYPYVAEGIINTPQEATTHLVTMIKKNLPEVKLLILSGSSFATKGDVVLEILEKQIGPNVSVVGGNSGDDLTLKGGYVFLDDQLYPDALLGIAIAGNFSYGIGQAYGWKPIGVEMEITKMEENRIYEIDGKPARKIYEDLFGERINELTDPAQVLSLLYPMGKEQPDLAECVIRTPVIFYPDGSIGMGGAFKKGDQIRIMLGDSDSVISAARESGKTASQALAPQKAKILLVFDCISRKRILGITRRSKEIAAIQENFESSTPLIGFYTYGEYSPFGGDLTRPFGRYHNQAIVTLALSD